MPFQLISKLKPRGDQPQAIQKLVANLKKGVKNQVLLGVTGSGKTLTMAWVIQKIQKPTLVISPNKTLAAQLYQEFKEFFPYNAVHYFVSYYDYYQPEAYLPHTDTYIEKDARINQEIDQLRHAAVQSLISRKDVIIVSSVSCIYNLGSPENYQQVSLEIKRNQKLSRENFLSYLTALQYQRNDNELKRGSFRVRGEIVDIFLVGGEKILRIEFDRNRIEKILLLKDKTLSLLASPSEVKIFPASFWVTPQEKIKIAISNIKLELEERIKVLLKQKKGLEAERLKKRTYYDLEMIEETGFCHGIENYSRHLEFRQPGQAPFSLIDYFRFFHPEGFLTFIDESHISLPQLKAMAVQDKIRKETLIEYGFRLPSAIDNRPLTLKEFEKRQKQTIYVSATPGKYEMQKAKGYIVEQIIRPTGLLEPLIEIRKNKNQMKDLIEEIKKEVNKKNRVLVMTITKRLAEEIADFLLEKGVKTQYLHSEIKTLQRPLFLKNLREGEYDVLVGINLLREGIDLPEVSLVAILDADKEGFLRNKTTLIQIMGRAARHPEGRILLYADKITSSMRSAIKEINRRRRVQQRYNQTHRIVPQPVIKDIRDWNFSKKENIHQEFWFVNDKKMLEKEMAAAIKNLDFERAAQIRDLLKSLSKKQES